MTNEELVRRAETLLVNTKRLRFFRGEHYNTEADDYLLELHHVLEEVIRKLK